MPLKEAEYNKIFSKDTMNSLKGKAGESVRQMLGNKTLRQTMMGTMQLLEQVGQAEHGFERELEVEAIRLVEKAYPIIGYNGIRIDAKLQGNDFIMGGNEDEEERRKEERRKEEEEEKELDYGSSFEMEKNKRRIINGITQGAAIRGSFAFLLFRESLDEISPELVQKYNDLMKLVFGIYDNDEALAMFLATIAQNSKMKGGDAETEYDEEEDEFVIKARAICFPMLVHEIVKGLYEIVGTEGFGHDKDKNKQIVKQVDKVENEPEDLRYGKFIYDALNNLYIDSEVDDARVRELFLVQVYKLSESGFLNFIENLINGKLTPNQQSWVKRKIAEIQNDLKDDDSDEILPDTRSNYNDEDDEDDLVH
jgi:hypothetical protein